MQSDELQDLIDRVASLELDNKNLKQEIKELKSTIRQKQNKHEGHERKRSHRDHKNTEEERARRGIFLDRYERALDIGDEVFILTTGAHTARSRSGTVTGFDNHRNRVYILDERRVTQERAPKNLRLENRISK